MTDGAAAPWETLVSLVSTANHTGKAVSRTLLDKSYPRSCQ